MKRSSKDMGMPTVMMLYSHATPDEIRQNRQQQEAVLSKIVSRQEGTPISAKINWDSGKPPWYGQDYIQHGNERIFPAETEFTKLPPWAQEILNSTNIPNDTQLYSLMETDPRKKRCDV